jgi:hypothetical protein
VGLRCARGTEVRTRRRHDKKTNSGFGLGGRREVGGGEGGGAGVREGGSEKERGGERECFSVIGWEDLEGVELGVGVVFQ